ncbi:hypothetical protein BDV96DRAFT_483296 [Lophiotrema nucula]|uniref:FHA domain-containing protein n=1 Tax=Lophiotrema nucula TaxID=690887 RepID=A0A6A5ZVG1_9PLEO|nr:hypothetical protein BDV96DRAFT_483296 [Lophiotrema nucula]
MDSSPSSHAPQSLSEPAEQRAEPTRKPSLLPAFEPLSSSPFPRPQSAKRKFSEDSPSYPKQQLKYYPTPVPTSSTGILPSSPRNVRLGLQRTVSTLSERMPLGDVPSVHLPANGEITRMGRSSNSSDYQLSANRLISRVHVHAAYLAPTASCPNGTVEIECLGWNGAKIHCRGHIYELNKGETYVSENPEAEIMLDVQETRVMIVWPDNIGRKLSWDSEDDTPTRRTILDHIASSPPLIPRSPVSQSPIRQPVFNGHGLTSQSPAAVQVFEDVDPVDENVGIDVNAGAKTPTRADETFIRPSLSRSASAQKAQVQTSILSSLAEDDFSDGDEENDPVVHSFGPFGANLLPRLASFSTASPLQPIAPPRRRQPLATSQSPQQRSSSKSTCFKESPIKNHVINQLAFSRIHSIPLSTIHNNLPAELRACAAKAIDSQDAEGSGSATQVPQLSTQDLKKLMDDIACIGEIPRSGKDAAGKSLENEFYYVPEMDADMMRRETVTGGMRGTGLRAVRKQHKQYYWKKPKH